MPITFPRVVWTGGCTALLRTAARGFPEIAEMLLTAGADKDFKDKTGKTALEYATEYSHPKIVEMLSISNIVVG